MNKSIFLSVILFIIFSSCDLFQENNSEKNPGLSEAIKNIIAGKDTTTTSLMIFRDNELPPADNPNKIVIDTINAYGKNFYTVLAEYPNPVYNRFAIIDSDYNVLLLDKSLNGNLAEEPTRIGSVQFVKVEENFISKGVLQLKRLSLYSIYDKGDTELALKTFTELKEPGITFVQNLIQIAPNNIETQISSSPNANSKLKKNNDVFLFNPISKRYESEDNVFSSFVLAEVESYNSQTDKLQIISRDSLLKQMGITHFEKKTDHRVGKFSMPLSDDWNEIKNIKISSMLKRIMPGTKFINNHYGAEISVIQLPGKDSSENYIAYPLENISSGNYRVRFSEKISDGKYFYQFFEYSCNSEKFLLILQTLKSTYETYKSDYQNLINSFSMEC